MEPARDRRLEEAVIEQLLEGQPRAEEWREWKRALERRLALLKRERDSLPPGSDTSELDALLRETQEQVDALSTETAITQFVEDAARFSLLAVARPVDEDEAPEE